MIKKMLQNFRDRKKALQARRKALQSTGAQPTARKAIDSDVDELVMSTTAFGTGHSPSRDQSSDYESPRSRHNNSNHASAASFSSGYTGSSFGGGSSSSSSSPSCDSSSSSSGCD